MTLELPHVVHPMPAKALPSEDEMGLLNDDVMIEIAPSRPHGTIRGDSRQPLFAWVYLGCRKVP